jgi:uncharacterized protein (DUF488 family)
MEEIRLFTIGFAKKPAQRFFSLLIEAGVRRVLDIRLNNVSQLAGFTKQDDLRYFLKTLGGMDYQHLLQLAPTKEILARFRKEGGDWPAYEREFLELLARRRVEEGLSPELLDRACLLCSEESPEHCHRRLAAEYLRDALGDIAIIHLL